MKRISRNRLAKAVALALTCSVCIGTGYASTIYRSAKGEFSTFMRDLRYDPSRGCTKPMRPYSKDKWAWDNYRRQAEEYLSCLKESADSDSAYAQEVIQAGYEKAVDDFLSEVKRGY